jgi:hypothetical protein
MKSVLRVQLPRLLIWQGMQALHQLWTPVLCSLVGPALSYSSSIQAFLPLEGPVGQACNGQNQNCQQLQMCCYRCLPVRIQMFPLPWPLQNRCSTSLYLPCIFILLNRMHTRALLVCDTVTRLCACASVYCTV